MSVLVIPVYIRSQWDVQCLERLMESIYSQSLQFEHVFIVDDASPKTYSIKNSFVKILNMPENGGPAKARNTGIEQALEMGVKNIFFTDHDCVLHRCWNEEMSRFLDAGDFDAVGGMTYSLGSTLLDYYHEINGTLCGKWLLPDRKELWYMPSLNFGMHSRVAMEFNYDERFPTAAGEDVDLCLRLRSKYRIGFCPKATVWHDYGYKNTISGLKRFISLFMKYKSSSATLYEGHTVLLWDSSESIYKGNAYESHI